VSDRAELLSVVLASVRGMPSSHVRALAAALASVAGTQAEARPAVLGAMPNPAYRQHALQLLDAWAKSPGTPAVALGLALESALAIREHEREAETIEVKLSRRARQAATSPSATQRPFCCSWSMPLGVSSLS